MASRASPPPASRPQPDAALPPADAPHSDGRRKAAILLLALGEHSAAKLCAELSDRDITNLAIGFADLGRLDAEEVEKLIEEFATHVSLSLAA
jgi:flagellar motor switch protein FliG